MRCLWILEEEGVMCIPGWMLLWLKQRIKVPEGALNEIVCWHFTEPVDTCIHGLWLKSIAV